RAVGRSASHTVESGGARFGARRLPHPVHARDARMPGAMNPDLEKLIHLQRAESELRRVEAERAEAPKRKAALEARLAEERATLDAAKEALTHSQKARRQHEGELQDLESKKSKYAGQLMDVKTNKEYTAMLHEIESVKQEIRSREDQILTEMEKAEALA